MSSLFIQDFALCCNLGRDKVEIWNTLKSGTRPGCRSEIFGTKKRLVAKVPAEWLASTFDSKFDTRVNRLTETVLLQIESSVETVVQKFGADRIGVFVGSSDNGSEESIRAFKAFRENGNFPEGYVLKKQQADFASEYVRKRFALRGPAMTLSSACASSASAFASARDWIEAGFCDAAIVGGVDIASAMVVLGFDSLEALSQTFANPFSKNRSGLTIGEGAAYFVISKNPAQAKIKLLGLGESSDADHLTAPRPDALGAIAAMKNALTDAEISSADIDYVNLHGTGTRLNDSMESLAVHSVLGDETFASSTKGLTGHTLGASGALEAAFCCLALSDLNSDKALPVHLFDGERDPALPSIRLVCTEDRAERLKTCMSNSFGFGGCNVSLIFARNE